VSGLYDRITPATESRVPIHYLEAACELYAQGTVTSRAALIQQINGLLSVPLSTEAEADLVAMFGRIDAKATMGAKSLFVRIVNAANITAEAGAGTEAFWRTTLEVA